MSACISRHPSLMAIQCFAHLISTQKFQTADTTPTPVINKSLQQLARLTQCTNSQPLPALTLMATPICLLAARIKHRKSHLLAARIKHRKSRLQSSHFMSSSFRQNLPRPKATMNQQTNVWKLQSWLLPCCCLFLSPAVCNQHKDYGNGD